MAQYEKVMVLSNNKFSFDLKEVIYKMRKIILFSLTVLELALPKLALSQTLYEVPDSNLVKALQKHGCITNGRLDSAKASGSIELAISNSHIKSLKGLQNLKQLESLICATNDLESLDYLPPNLKNLNCFENKITKLENLPASLRLIICGHNLISEISSLPPILWKLDMPDNKLTSLPYLPQSLQYINFANNPIDKSLNPGLTFNCDNPYQNCLPYNRIHWGILRNNFDSTPAFDTFYIVISTARSWGGGELEERITYVRTGKYLVADKIISKASKNGKDSIYGVKLYRKIRIDSLVLLLKEIKRGDMKFVLKDENSYDTLDLSKKKNTDFHRSNVSCSDCNGYHVTFRYCNKLKKNCYCLYSFDDANPPIPYSYGEVELPVLKDIMDWLYFYQLVKVCLPPQHDINEYDFKSDRLKQVVDWYKKKD